MQFLRKTIEQIIQFQKNKKSWWKVVRFLECITVFVTTYALILPAISLSQDTARQQDGIVLEESVDTVQEAAASGNDMSASSEQAEYAADGPEQPSGDAVQEEEFDAAALTGTVYPKSLDLRSEKKLNAGAIMVIPQGTLVTVLENQGDGWLLISTPDGWNGYVKAAEIFLPDEKVEEKRPKMTFELIADRNSPDAEISEAFINGTFSDPIKVHVEAPVGAFPAGTTMKVRPIAEEQIREAVESVVPNPESVSRVSAVDITFLDVWGDVIEPDAEIKVSLTSTSIPTDQEPVVVHVDDKGQAEMVEAKKEEEKVVFESDKFSVYAVVGTVIEKYVLASDGRNYRITATYGPEAGVPEDAQLKVSEILPPESDETIAGSEEPLDSSLYDEYVARTEDALGWAEGSASYVRLFDIKITDEYGNKIDIAAPVDVRIELADKDSSEEGLLGTQVVHFADGAEVPDVVQNLSFDETKTESEGMTLSFTAAGFSVYAIVDAPEPAVVEIDYVDSLEELAGQTGKEFYLSYGTPPKYFTNELNTNSAFIENTSSGQADGWYFEPTGVDNQYYIYTYVEGVKKYITNPSGNLAGLADTNGTKFDLEDAGNGKFYFKKAGASLWLQHSGSGSGIRFYTDNKNAANSQISIAYASSFVLPDDPYGLNGKTYGIAYHNDTATSAALTAEGVTTSGQQRLKGLDMLMRPDVLDHDGILLVAENSDIQEWTFQNVSEDKYYLKTTVDGVTKYLTINGNNVTLMDTPDETYSLIKAIPGTGANSGKWHFSVGNYSLNFNNTANNGFNGTTGTGATTWMNLVEKSSFPEEDFTYYNAKKVSVSDTSQVPDKKQVIIYTRVWNDTKKKYEFFAIDHDGSLIPCYDTGDGIEWIGTNVNTALWELTEGTNPDGSLSYYYWLRNTQYGNTFITPQLSNDQVIYTSPGSDVQDLNASVNLNGRRYEENYTTIIRWDDDQYGYSGLKVENGRKKSSMRRM